MNNIAIATIFLGIAVVLAFIGSTIDTGYKSFSDEKVIGNSKIVMKYEYYGNLHNAQVQGVLYLLALLIGIPALIVLVIELTERDL